MYEPNRSILIVRPKMPYVDWANYCDDGFKLTLEKHREDSTTFLIPEVESKEDEERVLKKHFRAIFEHELFAWTTDEGTWPKQRNLKTFKEWFEVEFHGVAIDLCDKQLWRESLDDEIHNTPHRPVSTVEANAPSRRPHTQPINPNHLSEPESQVFSEAGNKVPEQVMIEIPRRAQH